MSNFYPGDPVRNSGSGEIGRVVHTWNDPSFGQECQVLFHGWLPPPKDGPCAGYLLKYMASSLIRLTEAEYLNAKLPIEHQEHCSRVLFAAACDCAVSQSKLTEHEGPVALIEFVVSKDDTKEDAYVCLSVDQRTRLLKDRTNPWPVLLEADPELSLYQTTAYSVRVTSKKPNRNHKMRFRDVWRDMKRAIQRPSDQKEVQT